MNHIMSQIHVFKQLPSYNKELLFKEFICKKRNSLFFFFEKVSMATGDDPQGPWVPMIEGPCFRTFSEM